MVCIKTLNSLDTEAFSHIFSFLIASLILTGFSGTAAYYPDTQPQILEVILNLCLEVSLFICEYNLGYFWGLGKGYTAEETEKVQVELMILTMLTLILMSLGEILTSFNQNGLGLPI